MDAVVAALPAWRKEMGAFPVVMWESFQEYIQANVNKFVDQELVKKLMYELESQGEVL